MHDAGFIKNAQAFFMVPGQHIMRKNKGVDAAALRRKDAAITACKTKPFLYVTGFQPPHIKAMFFSFGAFRFHPASI